MITVHVKLFASLRDLAPPGAVHGKAALSLPDGTTLTALLAHLGVPVEEAHMVVVNGRSTVDLSRALADGDTVAVFPPVAGGGAPDSVSAEIVDSDPQPVCESLDPGTRVKTHVVRVRAPDGSVLWERSLYSQYDTRQVLVTGRVVLVGYDDRVCALDAMTGRLGHEHRMYLFEFFEEVPDGRILVKEKGSLLLLDTAGTLVWEHGGTEILSNVLVHGRDHVFVHFWGGSEVAGVRVPFACLSLATGQVDLAGPPTAPDYARLVDVSGIAGPYRDRVGELIDGASRLKDIHPSPWTIGMWRYVAGPEAQGRAPVSSA
jgi:molybdopterin converting factor small subunit